MAPPTDADALEVAKEIVGYVASDRDEGDAIYTTPIYTNGLEVTSATASPVSVTFTMRIPDNFGNPSGGLHGGAAATIIDDCSSHAISTWAGLMSRENPEDERVATWIMSGTSRTLNISYLRPAPVGTQITLYNEVQSVGKSLAFVRTTLMEASSGKVLMTGEHHKAAVKPRL